MASVREVLRLHRSGEPPAKIAAELDVHVGTVRRLILRGRQSQPVLPTLPRGVPKLLRLADEVVCGPYYPTALTSALRLAGCKWCTGCKAWHRRGTFGRNSTMRDGLASSCRKSRALLYDRLGRRKDASPVSERGGRPS